MSYTIDLQVRSKIDTLLQKIASLESALGKDSTPREITDAKAKQNK